MKKFTVLLSFLFILLSVQIHAQDDLQLKHLASYETGGEGSAEVVAYHPGLKYAFITSSENNSFSIINISNPTSPSLVKEISLAPYGAGPNSIAVIEDVVVVAVENANKQENGKIVAFTAVGELLVELPAGALPDMCAFTPDGEYLFVANEGEPSDDYSVDPEGSITVIDGDGVITNITFEAFNDKKQYLINKGIRIFGNNGQATVAQDLEPEYIAFSEDSKYAYVNCQENNALIVIDIATLSIIDILPLGYKDHMAGTPSIDLYSLNELVADWPVLGTPTYDGGQPAVKLGGFSGMFFDEKNSTADSMVFQVVPDRGPNDAPVKKDKVTPPVSQNLRPFKLPNYQGRIVEFAFFPSTGTVQLNKQVYLTRKDGQTPITGKGNIPGFDEIPVIYADNNTEYANEDYEDTSGEKFHALEYDAFGGDFEGILRDKDGNFWMCDEYRPAIYKFDETGVLIERYVAEGTSLLGDEPKAEGTYGLETLPAVYSKRRANRGFEAIAYDEDKNVIYAFIQSPMYNPDSSTKNKSDVIRILGIDATTGVPVSEYLYFLERNRESGLSASRVDKIGDAVYTGNGKFMVIERDSEGPDNLAGKKYIFEINLLGATNVLNHEVNNTKAFEGMTIDSIYGYGIQGVHKRKVVNLPSLDYKSSDKAEGIAILPGNKIAVMNDNDFGLAGAGITDNSVLGIISFANDYTFDASNKDDAINFNAHPTLGMYMPDAIATYTVDNATYIVTANEGDARDYDGYSEEKRVKKLKLDPEAYPNAEALQADDKLGRLKSTNATGDYDNDGDIDQIYSYGGRSFSIFDQYGNLVFDSANEFGKKTAELEPELFNEDEGEFDGRSDDKGVEPEAIAVGKIGDYTYAFIGCERQSSVLVYDITNPYKPSFITYYNNRTWENGKVSGDVAPEVIQFLNKDISPNNKEMLLVGYEVSGSLGIIQIGEIVSVSETLKHATFKAYPNPVQNQVYFDSAVTGGIYSMSGVLVQSFEEATSVNVAALTAGVYVVRTNKGVQRIFKF